MVYFLALIKVEILSLQIQKFDEIASFLAMTDWNEQRENDLKNARMFRSKKN